MRPLPLANVTALLLALATSAATAQQQPAAPPSESRALASRAELDSLLKRGKVSDDEAAVIRDRLKNGDFAPGDRIVIHVAQEPTLNDTFPVKIGRILILPNLPEISMAGVLRSEAQSYLTAQIGKYVKDPTVIVDPLVRVSILGAVQRPGFYTVRADMLASEVVMAGGGPTSDANLRKAVIRRNGVVVRDDKQLQVAFNRGVSLDALNLQAGDEIYVGTKANARNAIGYVAAISGGILAIVAIARLF
jgi:protein involved in polysaccharide export with SLBB domain